MTREQAIEQANYLNELLNETDRQYKKWVVVCNDNEEYNIALQYINVNVRNSQKRAKKKLLTSILIAYITIKYI